MHLWNNRIPFICWVVTLSLFLTASQMASAGQAAPGVARVVGTVQAISGKSLTVISDSGSPSSVVVEDAAKLLQIEPGKTDLNDATPFSFAELQPGDRVLVRGILADDGKTIRAASLIAVKKAALTEKQSKDRAEWQRGVGGLVKSVDASASTISVTTNAVTTKKEVIVHFAKDTVFRRYASASTRFDAARVAPVAEIQPGDQLRAKGSRSQNGADFNATEIVSGTFRNIAGMVTSSDPANNILVVQDLASKTSVRLKITAESQMRKLPSQFAESLAARLKNQSAGAGQSQPTQRSTHRHYPSRRRRTDSPVLDERHPGHDPFSVELGRRGAFRQLKFRCLNLLRRSNEFAVQSQPGKICVFIRIPVDLSRRRLRTTAGWQPARSSH